MRHAIRMLVIGAGLLLVTAGLLGCAGKGDRNRRCSAAPVWERAMFTAIRMASTMRRLFIMDIFPLDRL